MKAYIFDLDGTLLDSMGVWTQIDIDFLANRGLEVSCDFIDAVSSMSFPEAAAYTIARFNLPDTVEMLLQEWNAMAVHAYGHTVQMKPYAKDYLQQIKAHGNKIAIATSLPAELYKPALRNCGIEDLLDAICSTDEVAHGKTHPDVYLLAAQRLDTSPDDCVVFEDILEAIISAKRAGMTVYGVYDEASKTHWNEIQATADGILYDFQDTPSPA